MKVNDKQIEWLVKHFKHTKNDIIAIRLQVSPRTVSRLAKAYGLSKTPQFMRKCQAECTAAAKVSHLQNGTYPPKGFIIPKSEIYRFRKGETPEQRLGKRRNQQRIAKIVGSRAETLASERLRAKYGLKQKTKLNINYTPVALIKQRNYLKRRGYKLDEDSKIAYYSDSTQRAVRLEKKECFYRFEKIIN